VTKVRLSSARLPYRRRLNLIVVILGRTNQLFKIDGNFVFVLRRPSAIEKLQTLGLGWTNLIKLPWNVNFSSINVRGECLVGEALPSLGILQDEMRGHRTNGISVPSRRLF